VNRQQQQNAMTVLQKKHKKQLIKDITGLGAVKSFPVIGMRTVVFPGIQKNSTEDMPLIMKCIALGT